jgi:uncharacterized membrane protein
MRIQMEISDGIRDYVPSYINKLDTILIYFFGVGILMYKQTPFVITASILLTAFLTIALYTGSEARAQASGGNMTSSNATAASGGNMTSSNATAASGGNMTSSNATAASGGNMTQPLVPPKPHP